MKTTTSQTNPLEFSAPLRLLLGAGLLLLTACSAFREVSAPAIPAASAGSRVGFSRVMNPSLAEGYVGADITTRAEFLAPNPSQMWQVKVPRGYMVIQVVAPGSKPQANPLSGAAVGDYVFVPTRYADMVYSLRRGDLLELRGGTVVTKEAALVRMVGGHSTFVQFKAISVKKAG